MIRSIKRRKRRLREDLVQRRIREELSELQKGNGTREVYYPRGAGVRSAMVSSPSDSKPTPVLYCGDFRDCSGLVFQTEEKASVLHISPYVLDEMEGRPDSYRMSLDDTNYMGHLYSALLEISNRARSMRGIRNGFKELRPPRGREYTLDIDTLQQMIDQGELRCNILAGNIALATNLLCKLINEGNHVSTFSFTEGIKGPLPRFHGSVYDFGEGRKDLYVTPDIMVVKKGDSYFQEGLNFPRPYFSY